jgi:hypothetical protein
MYCTFEIIYFNIVNVKETNEMLHLELDFYGAETRTLRKVDEKYLESLEMWCWRRMENISLTDHVKNEGVLHRVKDERNILCTIKQRKANWNGDILRRNWLLNTLLKER